MSPRRLRVYLWGKWSNQAMELEFLKGHCGIVVVGAGGHARVVVSTLRAAHEPVAAVFDDDPTLWDKRLLGVPIRGPVEKLSDFEGQAVIGIGDPHVRKSLVDRLQIHWATVIHPSSFVDPAVPLGEGSVIFAGAVVQPESRIGAHAVVNTSATVDHNCIVEDFAQIAPGANLCGSVSVGTGSFVGANAVVIEKLKVGQWSTVGAGAVVIRDLPDKVVAVGCPARIIKQLP